MKGGGVHASACRGWSFTFCACNHMCVRMCHAHAPVCVCMWVVVGGPLGPCLCVWVAGQQGNGERVGKTAQDTERSQGEPGQAYAGCACTKSDLSILFQLRPPPPWLPGGLYTIDHLQRVKALEAERAREGAAVPQPQAHADLAQALASAAGGGASAPAPRAFTDMLEAACIAVVKVRRLRPSGAGDLHSCVDAMCSSSSSMCSNKTRWVVTPGWVLAYHWLATAWTSRMRA